MLKRLPATVIGCIALTLFILETLFVYVVLFLPLNIVKWLIPIEAVRKPLTRAMIGLAGLWGIWNRWVADFCFAPDIRVNGLELIQPGESYLILCNHQSWADIPVHGYLRPSHMPFPRFFLKYELIWVPVIGWACWAMDFPFMRRPSREERARNPDVSKKDLKTTREACEHFRDDQVNVMNYAEGTRFTERKRIESNSPHRNLLRPKCGGIALVMGSMGDQFDAILDMTLVYPPGAGMSIWDFLCGRHFRIVVDIRQRAIPADLLHGDYQNDESYRQRFHQWINGIWKEKDALITRIQHEHFALEMAALNEQQSAHAIPTAASAIPHNAQTNEDKP